MGYSEDEALLIITEVSKAAIRSTIDFGETDPAWLAAINAEASRCHLRLHNHRP
jgi:hypothetical protein